MALFTTKYLVPYGQYIIFIPIHAYRTTNYYGIYRDDGIISFKGKWTNDDVERWLNMFQLKVFDLCGSRDLIFTSEIWSPSLNKSREETKISDNITLDECKYFPYIDLEMVWSRNDALHFQVLGGS